MKITGQILKENRERKGISIAEIALATKINARTILAMEEGDLNNLPPKTFLRGFVRSYATYLELDVDSILNTFYEEMGSTTPAQRQPDTPSTLSSAPRQEAHEAIHPKTSMPVKITAITGILVLVVLILVFKNKMESYEKEAIVGDVPPEIGAVNNSPTPVASAAAGTALAGLSPVPSPMATSAPISSDVGATSVTGMSTPPLSVVALPVLSPSAIVKSTPIPAATPSPSPQAKPSPSPTAKPSPSATPTATPQPSPSPKPSPSPSPSPAASPSATPAATPSPTPKPARPQEVIIEALKDTEITAQIDGETKTFQLKADQVQTIKAKRKVVLRLTDGGSVNLTVNGSDRGVPGDLGKPARVELP